jgi:autotransporter family porin
MENTSHRTNRIRFVNNKAHAKNRVYHGRFSQLALAMGLAFSAPFALADYCVVSSGFSCNQTVAGEDLIYSQSGVSGIVRIDARNMTGNEGKASLELSNSHVVGDTSGHGINIIGQGAELVLNGNNSVTLNNAANDTAVLVMGGYGSGGNASITVNGVLNIDVNNPGMNNADGLETHGIDTSILHHATGKITTNGGNGIWGDATHDATVIVDGGAVIDVSGDDNDGIKATANNNILVQSNAKIDVSGNKSRGIAAFSRGGTIDVTSSGNISTSGNDASGIRADSDSTATSGDIKVLVTGGEFNISGAGSDGIHANVGDEYGTLHAANSGNLVVDVTANITTNDAGGSEGIFAGVQGTGSTGNIDVIYRSGNIITNGAANARGIYGRQLGQGNLTITNVAGEITTHGNASHGIYGILSQSGTARITNNGNITTHGAVADAIRLNSNSNDVAYLHNSGTLTTYGDGAKGIFVSGQANQSGLIWVDNEGDIYTNSLEAITPADNSLRAHGIYAENYSTGDSDGIRIVHKNGTIATTAADGSGVRAESSTKSGNIDIWIKDATIKLDGPDSDGVFGQNNAAGASDVDINIVLEDSRIDILQNPTIAGSARYNYGIVAIQKGTAAGDINITNKNTAINIGLGQDGTGSQSTGIYALFNGSTATGNINIFNSGEITLASTGVGGTPNAAIYAKNMGVGDIVIDNFGNITTTGESAYGIHGWSTNGGNVTIRSYADDITVASASHSQTVKGLAAIADAGGNASVFATGDITVLGSPTTGAPAAIEARSNNGHSYIEYSNGLAQSYDSTLVAWGLNSATAQSGEIRLGANATVKSTIGFGLKAFMADGNKIVTDASSLIEGFKGVNLYSANVGSANVFDHYGRIDVLSDLAVDGASVAGSTLTINNYGTIDGYVTFGDEDTTFSNWSSNSWNIRHFADTDGDGIRDAKEIAVSDFGAGYDVFKNEATGTVRLLAVSGETNIPVAAGYIPDGALDITNAGTVHGHLLNLDRFENRGTIDLSDNGQAGDVLLITGGATAGANGGGKFVADGGFLRLDTVLNDGGLNSLSDVLVVDDIEAGSDVTRITINRVGGMGAITIGDGIKVVDVLGTADAGSFALDGVVKGGIYEYTLHEGSVTTPGNNSLFLRTSAQQLNPDIGSYLANQTAATGLFMHSLHDRLGEPQLYQNYREEDKSIPAVWLRAVAGHTKNEAGGGLLNQHSESTLLHLGGEVADWSSNGDDRFHLGLMGAWGRVETKTTSQATDSRVKGTVDGYGVGAYLTWYDNPANVEGWYSDVWTMYNWFNNETEGSAKYDSESWTTSLEVGYAMKLSALENYDWMLEPQGQVAYNYYSVDSIQDRNGMKVTDSDANGFATRLGMRTYLRPSTFRNGAQPFFEVNWLYNSANNSMMFNDARIADDTPENRFEAKVGVQGEMTKHLQVYSHIGLQWGQNSYEHAEGQVGVRYRF